MNKDKFKDTLESCGGVFCSECNDIICKPRKRKFFRLSSYVTCDSCYNNGKGLGNEKKYYEDFSDNEKEIGDIAYEECMRHIKKTVHEYLDGDTIKHEIWTAISQGVCDYFEENNEEILGVIFEKIKYDLDFSEMKIEIKKK